MTGEITLRGRVLPIGGLKEKILAAKRAKVTTVILPKRNKKDLEEIPKHLLRGTQLIFVDTMDEVVKAGLRRAASSRKPMPDSPRKPRPAKRQRPNVEHRLPRPNRPRPVSPSISLSTLPSS